MLRKKQKNSYHEADLIRSFSTIGIVVFHTLHALHKHLGYRYRMLYIYPNGNCGGVFVAIFFILSGFLLYRRYSEKIDILAFYKKRWLSIFPSFYLSWIIFYFVRVFIEKKPCLWGGSIYRIILTILGMDGYFYYMGMNYYLVGEWFLGAIIILYLLFPMLLKAIKKHPRVLCIGIAIVWFWQMNTNAFIISSYRNIISCLVSFLVGILYAKHYERVLILQKNLLVVGSEIVLFVICRCFYIPIDENIIMHIMGAVLYLLFVALAMIILEWRALDRIITWIASVSFCVYLVHHRIINIIIPHISKGNIYYDTTISLLICLPISIFIGYIVSSISNRIKSFLS